MAATARSLINKSPRRPFGSSSSSGGAPTPPRLTPEKAAAQAARRNAATFNPLLAHRAVDRERSHARPKAAMPSQARKQLSGKSTKTRRASSLFLPMQLCNSADGFASGRATACSAKAAEATLSTWHPCDPCVSASPRRLQPQTAAQGRSDRCRNRRTYCSASCHSLDWCAPHRGLS
jgi:hypothetical protein